MPRSVSPLRYPGGKTCLHPILSQFLRLNSLQRGHYAEPYAGGCGLALALLFDGHVHELHLNDFDPGIWSFWHAVLQETDELCSRIRSVSVTVEEWHRQREIERNAQEEDPLNLAFATFFLNRTNRSGIIKGGGIIGGLDQNGKYKIDCRFNKNVLIEKIQRIAKYREQIHLTNLDAIDFVARTDRDLPERALFCIDPPYFKKGSALYTSFYKTEDHAIVSDAVAAIRHAWILTYDNVPEISSLYTNFRQFTFDVKYSVQTKRVGTELMVVSDDLDIPSSVQRNSKFLQNAA